MKRILSILLVSVILLVQFNGAIVLGKTDSEGAWYLISQELIKYEFDGMEIPTSGLAGYFDYARIDYKKLENSHDASIIGQRTHIATGTLAIDSLCSIQWTDPNRSYNSGERPQIVLTRTTVKDTDQNQYSSYAYGIYGMSSRESYNSSVYLLSENDEHYVEDLKYGPTHRLMLAEPLEEGSLDGVDEFDISVTLRSGYTYIYHYKWRTTDPNAGNITTTTNFSDLSKSHWSYNYVQHMVDLGIIKGYTDGTFRPDVDFSRAAFAKLLALSFELKSYSGSEANYDDLSTSHWAYTYVMAAEAYLTFYESGSLNYYKPDEVAEREDVAVAMVKAMGLDVANADLSYLDSFTDKDDISGNLRPYIALAVEHGVMNGVGSDKFSPRNPLTRAQACTLFARFLMEIKDTIDPGLMDKVVN